MKKELTKLLLLLLCFASWQTFAQDRSVSGQVFDNDNLPLPGVTVQVKNSYIGTVTDLDGAFAFSVPDEPNSVLIFSF